MKKTKKPIPKRATANPVLLALGDSIVWGQGLRKDDKFCYMVAAHLRKTVRELKELEVHNQAHSGATVLTGSGVDDDITKPYYYSPVNSGKEVATGEIPRSIPTILDQAVFYDGEPDAVRYIIVDGGINDVKIGNIVAPLPRLDDLRLSIEQHCHREMTTLLKHIVTRFSHRDCRIVVTGYFPILSCDSLSQHIPNLLDLLRVPRPRKVTRKTLNNSISRALFFWCESDRLLAQSVKDVKDSRVVFVPSGFTDKNALFVPGTAKLRPPEFDCGHWESPVCDAVYDARNKECERYPQDSENRPFCPFASLGHPIEGGAQIYFDSIVPRLQRASR
ncbi:MAG TPA: hypothetical protein VEU51_06495 [Candidatus Acidoferrales bacterium]|nr:hypothetical protein [Candidatus Acidoferrales bacterium]